MNPHRYSSEHHCIRPSDLDPLARSVIERLAHHGYSAYLVGGGVRDLLLKKTPKDLDIATDATPRAIKSLFRNSRIIGRRFKLAQIFFGREKIFEVSTFRELSPLPSVDEDVQEGPSSPILDDNRFGTEETDAYRRDITINALYYDPLSSTIIDYVGGIDDMRARLIRIIGDPDVRISEDPVRMIRVVRHAARSGFSIEESTAQSVLRNTQLIHQCTDVRVFDEFRKDVLSGHFLKIVRLLGSMKLLEALLPSIDVTILEPHTPCSETLERLDDIVQNGEPVDLFIPLTLLALFSKAPNGGEDIQRVGTGPSDVAEYVRTFFGKMAVPRRERERITASIQIIHALFTEGVSGSFTGQQWGADSLSDADGILRVLPSSGHDRLFYRLLREARFYEETEGSHDGARKRGRSRSRGRRRRNTSGAPSGQPTSSPK